MSGIASFYLALITQNRNLSEQDITDRLREAKFEEFDIPYEEIVRVLVNIPEPILEVINRKLKRALENYAEKMESPSIHPLDYRKLHSIAQEEICNLLDIAKRHDEGKLNSDYFKGLWKNYDCSNYFA